MRKFLPIAIFAIFAALIGVSVYLTPPAPTKFARQDAIKAAVAYDARIIRDGFGVPHIYGERDADVAFGLAYAHAQDDWKTIEEVILFSRGQLAATKGKGAAIPDFLVGALKVNESVRQQYETDLMPETRALVEAYAAGVNFFCAEKRRRCAPGVAPVSGQDVIAGFASRTPFFYGLELQLQALFEGEIKVQEAADEARESLLHIDKDGELGSNAMAVAPSRSTDGHTRLMVNSHQPYTGPVAWYEARVKSDEGWDMIGGLFPGSPVILVGSGPNLGWAHTVNRPDLVDVYALTVDDEKRPQKYMFDGEWRVFESYDVDFRVKLFGHFSLPVKRRALHSVYGPVFETEQGAFAVSYAGAGELRTAEQWYLMNKAASFDEWLEAMSLGAIPSFNTIFADKTGNIAYFYNAAIPVRDPDYDWSGIVPGDTSNTLWQGQRPFGSAPDVINPVSGYVVNANNTPFMASGEGDNPDPDRFPPHFGIDQRTTNRGYRIQTLYGGDLSISKEEFIVYKMDHHYAEDSRLMEMVAQFSEIDPEQDRRLAQAIELLSSWDGSAGRNSRAAALAIITGQKLRGFLLDDVDAEMDDYKKALKETAASLQKAFGRIDPEWGEVNRLKRGNVELPLDGGPDTLRAVYATGDLDDGSLTAMAGDTYYLLADWTPDGGVEIETIHQFGSATLDQNSPHYADQAPLFAEGKWKKPPMSLEALLAEATEDIRPGK